MRQLLLTEIPLNPSVRPEDELRLCRQALVMYHRLTDPYLNKLFGPPSNVDLMDISGSRNFTARMSEIRAALEPLGLTVKICKKCPGGLNYYEIRNLEQ